MIRCLFLMNGAGALAVIAGFVLLNAPLLMTFGGIWLFIRERSTMQRIARAASVIALSSEIITIAWFWIMPRLISDISSDRGFALYRRFGELGLGLALLSLIAAPFSSKRVRPLAVISAIGIFGMWATIGVYPYP